MVPFVRIKFGVDSLRNGDSTVRCEFREHRISATRYYPPVFYIWGMLVLWNFEVKRSVIHFDAPAYLLLWWSLTWETTEAALLLFLSTGSIGKSTSCPETISQDCNRWIASSDSRRSLSIQQTTWIECEAGRSHTLTIVHKTSAGFKDVADVDIRK